MRVISFKRNFVVEEYVPMLRGQGKSEPLEILDSWRGQKCLVFEVSSVLSISGIMHCLRETSNAWRTMKSIKVTLMSMTPEDSEGSVYTMA
jgi:hypothetical protein